MKSRLHKCWIAACVVSAAGCPAKYREDLDYTYRVEQTLTLDEFPSTRLVQFESVHWDPEDCAELRALISDDNIAAGRNVLEIGTGAGIISALCLSFGAKRVVTIDPNPAAIANAVYNSATLELDDQLDARQVHTGEGLSFAAIEADERFGLIIVNATNRPETRSADSMIQSLLDQLPQHQDSGGRCIVASDDRAQIELWKSGSEQREYAFQILPDRVLGDRSLETMDRQVFPAVLFEIRVPIEQLGQIE
jgi:protein-L-isoaspartate O-methyltransferase